MARPRALARRAKVARRAGGTILDSHASLDPKMEPYLIDRKITCPDGTVRVGLAPDVAEERQGETQTGSWTIVSGTGAFEGLRGSGEMETCTAPPTTRPLASVNRDHHPIELRRRGRSSPAHH